VFQSEIWEGLLQLDRALQLSADMQKRNVPRNVHTHSALMNVCIKCGQLRLALECWENMQRDAIEPNVVRATLHCTYPCI
jgi:pentatricopeptide repeat domain-containing protein 1